MGPPSRFQICTFPRVWQFSIGVNLDECFFVAVGPFEFRINWAPPPSPPHTEGPRP